MATAYKLFRLSKLHKGELFPLYVNANKATPIGEWLEAESGERVGTKVKSKLGLLAYRPAWHLSDLPIATHMGVKDDNGKIAYMKDNVVWCECEYTDAVDYQNKANEMGMYNGKFNPTKAFLNYIPVNGFYRYKTNPNMMGNWILAGGIKIVKILTDEAVNKILINNNITPMPRVSGELNLSEYGFSA